MSPTGKGGKVNCDTYTDFPQLVMGLRPEPKTGAQPLSHPGVPQPFIIKQDLC